jgi:hypothetical protein
MKRLVPLALLGFLFGMLVASAAAQAAAHDSKPAGETRLIIVAPESFHPALEAFVAHKQTLLPTELRSLEGILLSGDGVDDPEKLKRFLYAEWKTNGLGYALLVGDVDILPVRYMVLDRVTEAAFDYAFYPSDLYYSDLARADGTFDNWNARKESFHAGYFGEVRGEKNKQDPINFDQMDYRPDIAVGRWPVSTKAEAGLVAAKTIAYETSVLMNPNPEQRRAAFFAVGGWVDSRNQMDRLVARLATGWQTERRFYSDDRQPSGTPAPDHGQLRALFNGGIGLAVHTGHGQTDSWEQCFTLRDLDRITNATRLPVVVSAGCSTAYFAPLAPYDGYVDVNGVEHKGTDRKQVFSGPPPPPSPYQRGRFNPTGLGEQILKRSPNGGVAYIGCNTGSQPCGLTLVEGFVIALAESPAPRLGDCWASAIRHYFAKEKLATLKPNQDWYPPSIFFQGMKFMVFGDPSLRLPANQP